MRYGPFAALALGLLTSECDNVAGPGDGAALYALHRIGDAVVPAPAWPGSKYPLVLADTLTLLTSRPRPGDSLVVSRVQVFQEESGQVDNNGGRFNAVLRADLLIVDSCPIGAFCLAVDLVYSPFVLRVVGDSLYEQVPDGSSLKPRVYGRVGAR
jgi:hypothetical protein